jgi:iron complex outermembrane receptor protein
VQHTTRQGLAASVAMIALVMAGAVRAQDAVAGQDPQATAIDDVVVTGERVARGNNVVDQERIEALAGGENLVNAIRLVPGVQIRGSDAFNGDPWSYGVNIRGFEVNLRNSKIGQTLDGIPLGNASYYLGGTPAMKYILSENADRIQVNQGTADVGSPSASALGGTIAYSSRDPSETFGGRISSTIASYDSYRFFADIDTGVILGNTRAYLSAAKLDTHLWPHGGSTPAGLEQFHVEGKSITDLGDLSITLRASYNDSDDDPVIESTRAFIEQTGYRVDGSSSVFNPNSATANEYWADEWAGVRKNTLGSVTFDWNATDTVKVSLAPYFHHQEGVGEFLPPYQEPRFVNTANPGALQQVLYAGSRIRTTLADNQGRAVLPYATGGIERLYTNLAGETVRSSTCFNPDNTPRAGADCSSAQSYRNSTYNHDRFGAVFNVSAEVGDHVLRAGVWYEHMDRDFGRKWYPYIDIRRGPIASGVVYREDFRQNFQTDLFKLHIADTWTPTDRLTVDFGLQHYFVDISGESVEDRNFNAAGQQISTTVSELNSDSDMLLPSIGAVYDLTDNLQIFGGYSRNFAAIGDWAIEKTGTDFSKLKPEAATNIDLGLRYSSRRVRAAATLYHIEYNDPIVFLTDDFAIGQPEINYSAGTGGTYFNVEGGVRSRGLEASVDFDVTRNIGAYAAVTVTDAIYTDGFRGASYGGNKVVVPKGANVAGTPDYMLAGALTYHDADFDAQVSVRHIGEAPGDAANTPALEIPAYTLVDLSATYRLPLNGDRSLEAKVAINNLFDERYIGGMLDDFTQRYTVGAPRSASLTVSMAF